MNYQVRLAPRAADDLQRLFDFLAEHDLSVVEDARVATGKAIEFLQSFPFACRKAAPDQPLLREMVIEFGQAGYVALYEIENPGMVAILVVRRQRESDFL